MGNLTKLSDTRVQAFIDWSQAAAKYLLHQHGTSSPSIVQINYWGWKLLKVTIRGDSKHRYDDDYDAAAAEHYMYIRFLAGHSGDPACYAAPTIYAAKKILDQLFGRLQSGQAQGGHPVLPSNPYIVAWGHTGVIDGLADYKTLSGGASYKIGNAVEALANFGFSKPLAKKFGDYSKQSGQMLQGPYAKPN